MRRIPRRVLTARPVDVAEHGTRAIRWNVLVLLRQSHAVRGPVVAGVINAIGVRPTVGVRTGQDVVLVASGRRPCPWNLVTFDIEGGRALDVVAIALLIAMQIGDVAGDELTLDVVPGGPVPMRSRALIRGVLPRCSWLRYACQVRVAACPPNDWASFWQIWSAPASPPRLPVPDGLSATKKLAA
jgi:hypothetical protein